DHRLSVRLAKEGHEWTSETRTFTVDRTLPIMVSRSPSPGATGVRWDSPIEVRFSEAIAPESVGTGSSLLVDGSGKARETTARLSDDGRVLRIVPIDKTALPTFLKAVLPALTDLAGNPLVVPFDSWRWQVPDWLVLPTPFPAMLPPGLVTH